MQPCEGFIHVCGFEDQWPGIVPFDIVRALEPDFETVTDDQVGYAVRVLFERFNLVVEPSGASAFASLLARAPSLRNATVVVVVSGGNVDRGLFLRLLAETNS